MGCIHHRGEAVTASHEDYQMLCSLTQCSIQGVARLHVIRLSLVSQTSLAPAMSVCTCSVEFLLAAGPAEALRPLGLVASGGEAARVMLALKAAPASVLAASDNKGEGTSLVPA